MEGAISRVCELVTIILLIVALIGLATCYVLSYLVEEDIKKNTWTKIDHRTIMAQKVAESFKTSIKFKEQDKKLVRDAEVAVRASKSNESKSNEDDYEKRLSKLKNKMMKKITDLTAENDEHRTNLSKSVEELSNKMEKDMAAVRIGRDEWERVIMMFVEEQDDHRRKDKDEFERNLLRLEEQCGETEQYMEMKMDEFDRKLWMLEERCNKLERQNEKIIKFRNDQILVEAERNLLYLLDNHPIYDDDEDEDDDDYYGDDYCFVGQSDDPSIGENVEKMIF